ncbi:MAG: glutamate-5-semialdehyde dehydrogenase [Lentisphaeria bacterium]|nr:glutamate-5-semialdehyde dehydrogenase [Lentisphaeria bacterium]
MNNLFPELTRMGEAARAAARCLRRMQTPQKNRCIEALADVVMTRQDSIIEATRWDLQQTLNSNLFHESEGVQAATPHTLEKTVKVLRNLAGQPDPVGRVDSTWIRPNGLAIKKIREPIGVIGVAFHGNMDSILTSAALCVKSNNAALLCTDNHWRRTNRVLGEILKQVFTDSDFPEDTVQIFTSSSPESYKAFLLLDEYIDLLIPKGDPAFIAQVKGLSRIPILVSSRGVCHIYVDKEADLDMALAIIDDARKTTAENSADTVLIHAEAADLFLPILGAWAEESSVTLLGDPAVTGALPSARPASASDWQREHPPHELAVKIVEHSREAVAHIGQYGAGHSDAIITQSKQRAHFFCAAVDSAAVYVNASTRFTHACHFGMGPQIVVGTGHFHARGPIGVEELTTYKFVIEGKGQIRE